MTAKDALMDADPSELASDVHTLWRDGFLILPGLLDANEVATLSAELEPWFERTPRCEGDFHGWGTTRVNALLTKAPMVQSLALHPRVLAIAEAVLAGSCDCIRLNLTQAIRIHPGERAQVAHRDEEMWPADPGGRIWSLNAMWAVSDFTHANGATRLWPGSHARKLSRDADAEQAIAANMKAGAVLLYLGGLTHCGGANVTTDQDRTGVVVGYCAGWLRTYEEQFLAYTPEIARSFSEPLQQLIGYRTHRPNLGSWEGQDPMALLRGGAPNAAHQDALPPAIAAELKALIASRSDGDGG